MSPHLCINHSFPLQQFFTVFSKLFYRLNVCLSLYIFLIQVQYNTYALLHFACYLYITHLGDLLLFYFFILFYLFIYFEVEFHSCYPGWSAMARSQLTTASDSWVQAILLSQPPEQLGLQVCATVPGQFLYCQQRLCFTMLARLVLNS